MHHVKYFEHGGPTDIDNLLPLCSKHHHCAHEGGWRIQLSSNRTLTINLPDGTTMCHGPPKALAA
jgi:predicted restriction endonuclease